MEVILHIRERRQLRGLTLEEVTELAEMAPGQLSRLECGEEELFLATLITLSGVLECNIYDLFD